MRRGCCNSSHTSNKSDLTAALELLSAARTIPVCGLVTLLAPQFFYAVCSEQKLLTAAYVWFQNIQISTYTYTSSLRRPPPVATRLFVVGSTIALRIE